MSDCPGILVSPRRPDVATTLQRKHCPDCQENAKLRAQLAQAVTLVPRLRALEKRWRSRRTSARRPDSVRWDEFLVIVHSLADLSDAPVKENP